MINNTEKDDTITIFVYVKCLIISLFILRSNKINGYTENPQLKESIESIATDLFIRLVLLLSLSEIPAHSIRQYIDIGLLIPFKLESKRHLVFPK